jgi:hypothetical protein
MIIDQSIEQTGLLQGEIDDQLIEQTSFLGE